MKIREEWILWVIVEHPNLPTVATAQSRFRSSHFVEVIFHHWNSYLAKFFEVNFTLICEKEKGINMSLQRLYVGLLFVARFLNECREIKTKLILTV